MFEGGLRPLRFPLFDETMIVCQPNKKNSTKKVINHLPVACYTPPIVS
jgi:hypothetical protein